MAKAYAFSESTTRKIAAMLRDSGPKGVPSAGPRRQAERIFPARIDSGSAGSGYGWTEMEPDGTAGAWKVKDGGRTSAACGVAYEDNDATVAADGTVIVRMHQRTAPTAADPNAWAYGFTTGGGGVAGTLVKVTGTTGCGGGKYLGRVLAAPASAPVKTGDLAEADLGAVPGADDCLVLNTREVGKATHDLATSGYLPLVFPAVYVGQSGDATPLPIYAIDGMQWEDCA